MTTKISKTTIAALSTVFALSMLAISMPQEAEAGYGLDNGSYTHNFAVILNSNGSIGESSSTITLCDESLKVYFKANSSSDTLEIKWEGQDTLTCNGVDYTWSSGVVNVDEYGSGDTLVDETNSMSSADSMGWVTEDTTHLDANDFIVASYTFNYTT